MLSNGESPFQSILHTNYVPDDKAIKEIKEISCQLQAEIDGLTVEDETRRQTLKANLDAHMALLSTIRQVADDVLLEIFHRCVSSGPPYPVLGDGYSSPLALQRVCRQWRHLVNSTPRFWAAVHVPEIDLPMRVWFSDALQESIDRHVLIAISRLDLWTARTGSAQISISCDGSTRISAAIITNSKVWTASHRIHELNIALGFPPWDSSNRGVSLDRREPWGSVFYTGSEDVLPNLTSLTLRVNHYRSVQSARVFLEQCTLFQRPHLRSLTLLIPILRGRSSLPFTHLSQLTSLSFLSHSHHPSEPPIRTFHHEFTFWDMLYILEECPVLVQLSLALQDATAEETRVAQLRHCSESRNLERLFISLPILFEKELDLHKFSQTLRLPNLNLLHVWRRVRGDSRISGTNHVIPALFEGVFSSLTSLVLKWAADGQRWQGALADILEISHHTPNLRSFELSCYREINHWPQRLSIYHGPHDGNQLLKALTPSRLTTSCIWPKLQRFSVDLMRFSEEALCDFIRSRDCSTYSYATRLQEVHVRFNCQMVKDIRPGLEDLIDQGLVLSLDYF